MAAETKKLRQELLSVGPFCMIETGELGDEGKPKHAVHYCSPNATRTQRSGVTDVKYMIRPDRRYWLVCPHSNPTRAHARASARHHPIDLAPCRTQRVQVCAAAARRRGGRRRRAVPRQPDGARGAVRRQLRRVRRALRQQDRARHRRGRQVLGRAAHPGLSAGAALERPGAGAQASRPRRFARSTLTSTHARALAPSHAGPSRRRTSGSGGAPSATTCAPPTPATASRRSSASSCRTASTRPTRRATP